MQVAIIGGGYAGMAAAVDLSAAGISVTVYEAALQLGGRARRVNFRDTLLDNGLHILIGAYSETLRLIRQVHPGHESALLRLPMDWHIHGEFRLSAPRLPAPLHLLAGVMRASGLSFSERLGLARFMVALQRMQFQLASDISVETLLQQHSQSEKVCRVMWRPLCVAALNTPPASASAQVFLNVIKDSLSGARDASDMLISRVDLSALFPEPAAAWITGRGGHVITGQRVSALETHGDGYAVTTNENRQVFSHVICAISPHQVHDMLGGIPALAGIADTINGLRYQSIHSVWLQYPDAVALPAPMLGLTGGLIHWVFDREKLCGQRGLVGAVISAEGEHQALDQETLGIHIHEELKQHFHALPEPLWRRVIAEKRATFSCTVGVNRPPQLTPARNFFLAGDYTASVYPATIEAAVRSGIICARHIQNGRHD